jgi:uncharacterized protein
MAEQTRNPRGAGAFCWYELATNDLDAAKKLYKELFGWETSDVPMPPGAPFPKYTMFEIKGQQVGGLIPLSPEMKRMNVPPHWGSYVEVENVEKSFEKAKQLGATGLTPVIEMGMGRMVLLQDPMGAALYLWQVTGGGGNMLYDQVHGNRCWNELLTSNVDRAGKFYSELFGWKPSPMQMPGNMKYTVFMRGQDQIGGMMEIQKEWGPVPPNWMIYFHVDDTDRAVDLVKRNKGQLHGEIMNVPEVGRIAMAMDPQGAPIGFVGPIKK